MPREAEVVEHWCSLTPTHVALHKTPEAVCKKEEKKKERPDPSLQAHGCADTSVCSQPWLFSAFGHISDAILQVYKCCS